MSNSRSVSVAAAASEPLTLSEVKKHLEIADSVTDHDTHLTALITAAREEWERDTHSLTTSRTVTERDSFVDLESWLSYRPVISLTSVTFDGVTQATAEVDAENGVLHLEDSHSSDDWDGVVITYVAGYATVPESIKAALKLKISSLFDEHRQQPHYDKAYEMLVRKYMRASYP